QGNAVHVCRNQSVSVECLLDGNAPNKCRHITGNFVQTAKHHVLAGGLNASSLKNLGKTRTAETGVPHCATLPLNPRDFGILKCTAVPRAFQSVGDRMLLDV